jgi:hypothetical protein
LNEVYQIEFSAENGEPKYAMNGTKLLQLLAPCLAPFFSFSLSMTKEGQPIPFERGAPSYKARSLWGKLRLGTLCHSIRIL